MDKDGAANINSSNVLSSNDVINNIDDSLHDSHDDELERRCDTENNTKRNQEGSSRKICRNHSSYIYINIWPATRGAVGGEKVNLIKYKKVSGYFTNTTVVVVKLTSGVSHCRWKNPETRMKTSITKAAHKRFKETAERLYFLRKVIKNPIPRKIMTWTSWNTEKI